jgi:Ca-activated chloride channel family protein
MYAMFLLLSIGFAPRPGVSAFVAVAQSADIYHLNVAVDEVSLTFHAADVHGLPVNDLKLDELRLLDNGKPPRGILSFQSEQNFPIRAGILMDTSKSMWQHLYGDRAISTRYAQRVLRQQTDQAFVMDFGYTTRLIQPWTGDPVVLTSGIRQAVLERQSSIAGTAVFDAIFRACFYEFGKVDHAASGNFILLFSDGEDNSSHVSLQEAVNACQQTHTAIYAFRAEPKSGGVSPDARTLAELSSQTGGRVFRDNESEDAIDDDLRLIEADLRNQYRLIYRPAQLKHDGSFHRITLIAPERVDNVTVRSGYYAPTR